MKTITYEQFVSFRPCWLDNPTKMREAKAYAKLRTDWAALDILDLTDVPRSDRLWLVLREDLIDAPILHEFACRCAEKALSLFKDPDPRSIEAIRVKRLWLKGEATNEDLAAAWAAAWDATRAAARASARDAARAAAWAAAWAAARAAAWAAAWNATRAAAWDAARAAEWDAARAAAWAAAEEWQIATLREMLAEV